VVGAFILTLLGEYLRITVKTGYLIIYGVILVFFILYLPKGLMGLVERWVRKGGRA
jgi:branched-chain amino acid transport system permease protein